MDIIFYHPTFDTPFWITELEKQLPDICPLCGNILKK